MTSREKFEAWVSDNGKFQRALECKGGIYLLATINTQWEAWQAASEASEQQLLDMSVQLANAESKCRELAEENAGMKSNLMYWNNEDAEPARSPLDIAHESSFGEGVEFDVQVAARMPSMTYRVVRRTTYSTEIELVRGGVPETPATDAFLAEVRAQGLESGVNTVIAMMNHQHPAASQAIDILKTHAAQLRKGVQP
ncbi:hypothetical protein ACEWMH_001036 [Citrobacter freundii]